MRQTIAVVLTACAMMTGCRGAMTAQPGDSSQAPQRAAVDDPRQVGSERGEPEGDDPRAPDDGSPPRCQVGGDVSPEPARRLTNEEFASLVQDTFGVDARQQLDAYVPDYRVGGFSNNAQAMTIDAKRLLVYLDVAHDTVARANWDKVLRDHASCQQMSPECHDGYIASLGRALWRRDLRPDEIAPMRALFAQDFDAGSKRVAKALLIHPALLYRLEHAEAPSPTDVATRLSFALWNSAPDADLLQRVHLGDLENPERYAALVDEMLDDPRANRALQRFVRDWLMLDVLREAPPEDDLVDADLIEAMQQETLSLFERLAWQDDASLLAAVAADVTDVEDRRLAQVYGIEPAVRGRLDLSGTSRRGLLGHASILAITGGKEDEILIYRGLFVLNNLLCQAIPEPTAELLGQAEVLLDEEWPGRQRAQVRLEHDSCGGCHQVFEPLGFALERFGPLGHERSEDSHGRPVRSDGVYPGLAAEQASFADLREFAPLLERDPRFSTCIAQKGIQFAWGRPLKTEDYCAVQDILAKFRAGGLSWKALLKAIVTHPSFRSPAEMALNEEVAP